ncbi:uncharacterized protein LOC128337063 [Hemicordylus capensis]|uniref:uncharacterized protein LOC128337063 n=1 Tax=Hemicordylus capensis TaxID=884348 RepID=UPI0023021522|nr:uncharacterized protein LOC128337063 [Hemicordylus capensis]
MSWPGEEWKVGLPAQALRAIAEVEQRLERAQKERQQKQVQLDTLEAVMHKQKQKHAEEKASGALLSQQNRGLAEACEQTERARQRLAQELQAKEAQLSCLEAQLAQAARHQAELEEELRRCQVELNRLQSRSHLVLLPSRWGSAMQWAEGGTEAKADPSRALAGRTNSSCPPLRGAWGKDSPMTCWQQQAAACPSAPPGSPVPTENGEGAPPEGPEVTSAGDGLQNDNEELRQALLKAEAQVQEKEKELWNLQGQLELTRAELAQWKKHREDPSEVGPLECRGRRRSEDVSGQRRSREQHTGPVGLETMPPGSGRRSASSSRLEQPAEKRGATGKLKGIPVPSPRPPSSEHRWEELQALKAEVLTLRRRLDASESQRKSLLETCWRQKRSQALASEKPAPALQPQGKEAADIRGGGDPLGDEALARGGGGSGEAGGEEAETGPEEARQQAGEARAGAERREEGSQPEALAKQGGLEALREELRALAAGKAEAEAEAGLAQRKLQSLQATLGMQTDRLAQAMEAQSCHMEELLADAEEKARLTQSLSEALEEAQKALEEAHAESRRLRVLLGQRAGEPHPATPTGVPGLCEGGQTAEAPADKPPARTEGGEGYSGETSRAGCPGGAEERRQFAGQEQLEASLARLLQENQALRKELEYWETQHSEGGGDNLLAGLPESAGSGGCGDPVENADVLEAAQKKELPSQGSRRDAQTQTEGLEGAHRRRKMRASSVAFDDTQYEPYGLPEVVMKGFADIPSGPSCPHVLRRGILGSASVARLAPRAEPEEDSPETEEGTGV